MQEGSPPATFLSRMPRTFYIFWAEWTTGIGGKKLSFLFTAEERGEKNSDFVADKSCGVWLLILFKQD